MQIAAKSPRALLWPFVIASGLGFLASLAVHVQALFGQTPFGERTFALHMALFACAVPSIVIGNRTAPQRSRSGHRELQALTRTCPPWMRWLVNATIAYGIIVFAIGFVNSRGVERSLVDALRTFSAGWMTAYAGVGAVTYGFIHDDDLRRCPNGHSLPPSAARCPRCGLPPQPD